MFLSKKVTCYAPVDGKVITLEKVNDPVFSKKVMGEGVAIVPKSNMICSPIKGKIKLLFHTYHAFVVSSEEGTEIMVHIGIDTVQCNGVGFKPLRQQNDEIQVGEPIIEIDFDRLHDKDMTTMMIVIDEEKKKKVTIKDETVAEKGKTILMKVQG